METLAVNDAVRNLWVPTGLILGFQINFFKWRVEREVKITDDAQQANKPLPPTYLIPSDHLGVVGMAAFVLGVILLPVVGLITTKGATVAFGLGVLLFVGQVLGLAGHYDLYNRRPRNTKWFPAQEKIVVIGTASVALIYLWQMISHQ